MDGDILAEFDELEWYRKELLKYQMREMRYLERKRLEAQSPSASVTGVQDSSALPSGAAASLVGKYAPATQGEVLSAVNPIGSSFREHSSQYPRAAAATVDYDAQGGASQGPTTPQRATPPPDLGAEDPGVLVRKPPPGAPAPSPAQTSPQPGPPSKLSIDREGPSVTTVYKGPETTSTGNAPSSVAVRDSNTGEVILVDPRSSMYQGELDTASREQGALRDRALVQRSQLESDLYGTTTVAYPGEAPQDPGEAPPPPPKGAGLEEISEYEKEVAAWLEKRKQYTEDQLAWEQGVQRWNESRSGGLRGQQAQLLEQQEQAESKRISAEEANLKSLESFREKLKTARGKKVDTGLLAETNSIGQDILMALSAGMMAFAGSMSGDPLAGMKMLWNMRDKRIAEQERLIYEGIAVAEGEETRYMRDLAANPDMDPAALRAKEQLIQNQLIGNALAQTETKKALINLGYDVDALQAEHERESRKLLLEIAKSANMSQVVTQGGSTTTTTRPGDKTRAEYDGSSTEQYGGVVDELEMAAPWGGSSMKAQSPAQAEQFRKYVSEQRPALQALVDLQHAFTDFHKISVGGKLMGTDDAQVVKSRYQDALSRFLKARSGSSATEDEYQRLKTVTGKDPSEINWMETRTVIDDLVNRNFRIFDDELENGFKFRANRNLRPEPTPLPNEAKRAPNPGEL